MQDLRKIITERIAMLEEKFKPEMIIVGSNTPTLLLGKLPGRNTIGVLPPLAKAASVKYIILDKVASLMAFITEREPSPESKTTILPTPVCVYCGQLFVLCACGVEIVS